MPVLDPGTPGARVTGRLLAPERSPATPPAPVHLPRRFWIAALVAVGTVAFLVRLHLLTQRGGLLGSDGYDDGVYYAAADALVHGRLPYRDFLFLQPPGTAVALAPFAWFGSVTRDSAGVIAARLCFIGIGAVNAALVMTIARRFGVLAALVAGPGYAVFLPAAYSERSTLLEPCGTCALLLAVLLADRAWRRPGVGMLVAGAVAGVSTGMRIWNVLPAAAIAVAVAVVRRRSGIRFAIGAATASAAIFLPFLLADPSGLVRQVVLDQAGRPRSASTPMARVSSFLGASRLDLPHPWSTVLGTHRIGLLLLVAVVVCGIAALTVRGARRFPLIAIATGAVLLASPSFFLHYGAFTAPWLVLTVAIGTARITSLLRSDRARPEGSGNAGAMLVGVALLAVLCLDLRAVQVARPSSPIPVPALRPAAQSVRGCVTSDDPQILAALDVLSRDYARGCEVRPDVTGYTYDRDAPPPGAPASDRLRNPLWQADMTRYLLSGDAVIVHRASTGLDPASNRRVRAGTVLARSGTWALHAVTP